MNSITTIQQAVDISQKRAERLYRTKEEQQIFRLRCQQAKDNTTLIPLIDMLKDAMLPTARREAKALAMRVDAIRRFPVTKSNKFPVLQ